jgi:hypothetical protein
VVLNKGALQYPYTLKEWVTSSLEVRVQSAGDRYFAEAYNPDRHQKRFSRYLQTILSGRSAKSAEVASFYEAVLNPSSLEEERHHARRRAWLRAFFRDEPEYERKLRAWIRDIENLYSTGHGT